MHVVGAIATLVSGLLCGLVAPLTAFARAHRRRRLLVSCCALALAALYPWRKTYYALGFAALALLLLGWAIFGAREGAARADEPASPEP